MWLQREALGGQVKFALLGDDNGSPDLNAVLYESPLIEPQDSGQYYYSDSFINLLSPGEKYWVVIDGYQNLLSDGYSTVGVSAQLTDTGEGLWFSNNGGTTWDSIPGIPLAIYVEGDTCLFAADIDPDFPLVCPNNPVSIGAGFGYASYLWSTGETSQEITVTTAGTYSVTVVDNDFCVGIGFIEVIPDVQPTLTLQDVTDLCEGSSTFLSAPPFYSQYIWSNGGTGSFIEITEPGLYWVEAYSAGGCSARDSSLVVEIGTPMIDLGEDTILCQGEVIQFDPGPDFDSYDWSNGAITRSIFVNYDAEIHVTVVDTNGCTSTSDTVSVIVFPIPDTPTISLDLGDLVSSFSFSYQWYRNGELVEGAVNQVFEQPDSGYYFVEIANGFGCKGCFGYDLPGHRTTWQFYPKRFLTQRGWRQRYILYRSYRKVSSQLSDHFQSLGGGGLPQGRLSKRLGWDRKEWEAVS